MIVSSKEADELCKEYGCPHSCGECPVWGIINGISFESNNNLLTF